MLFLLGRLDVTEGYFKIAVVNDGRTVQFALGEVPYLKVLSDGGHFLFVEPCWGLTEHDEQRLFENKEGIHVIAAGGELRRSFGMTPQIGFRSA